jgi:hypothetical protein
MVVVPAGQFAMGSPPDEPERDGAREDQVRVTFAKPFAIGAFAVTRGEFAIFVAATGYTLDEGCYFWTGITWEERADRIVAIARFRSGRSASGDVRRLEGCQGLHGMALRDDREELPLAIGDGARICDARRHGDPVLVELLHLDGLGQLQWQRWRRAGPDTGVAAEDGSRRQLPSQRMGAS